MVEINYEFMNKPIDKKYTEEDIVREYKNCNDIKSVARIYNMSAKQVREIIKKWS